MTGPAGDSARRASPTMRLALRTVFPSRHVPIVGSREMRLTDERIRVLAEAAECGPLNPQNADARRVWYRVLRGLVVVDIDVAATAARLWLVALDEATFHERIACIEDRAWAAYAAGVLELLRGHIVAAEGWFDTADVEATAQSYSDGPPSWVSTTSKELGVAPLSSTARGGSRVS